MLDAALAERELLKQALADVNLRIDELTSSSALELLAKFRVPLIFKNLIKTIFSSVRTEHLNNLLGAGSGSDSKTNSSRRRKKSPEGLKT